MKKTLLIIMSALILAGCFTGCSQNGNTDNGGGLGMPVPGGREPIATGSTDKKENENLPVTEEKDKKDETVKKEDTAKKDDPQKSDSEADKPKQQTPPDPAVNKQPSSETNTQIPPEPTSGEQSTLTTIQKQKPINKPTTYKGDKYLLLVNPWNYLPEDFKRNTKKIEGHYIDVGAYDDIVQMLADMRKEGLKPYICSSTRTIEYQEGLFNKRLKQNKAKGLSAQDALDETAKWTAIPGTSEHHTGYALDIVASYNTTLNESQENTPEQKWMMENSWKYGFILRYPKGKTDITGIYYEPWHYRYVGKDAAKEIFEADITFEEYIEKLNG